jgi:hypothetical protein
LGRYEHARACHERARAARAKQIHQPSPLFSVEIFGVFYRLFIPAGNAVTVLSVRLSTPGRHPKISGFDVAEGRF